jgi:hypothetical protein
MDAAFYSPPGRESIQAVENRSIHGKHCDPEKLKFLSSSSLTNAILLGLSPGVTTSELTM